MQFNPPISNFIKITLAVLELSHADKWTDSHGEAAVDLHKQILPQYTRHLHFCAMITISLPVFLFRERSWRHLANQCGCVETPPFKSISCRQDEPFLVALQERSWEGAE